MQPQAFALTKVQNNNIIAIVWDRTSGIATLTVEKSSYLSALRLKHNIIYLGLNKSFSFSL